MSDYPKWFLNWVEDLSRKDLYEIIWNKMEQDDKDELEMIHKDEEDDNLKWRTQFYEEKKVWEKKIEDLVNLAEQKESVWKKELTKIELYNHSMLKCGDMKEYGLVSEFQHQFQETNQRRGKLEEEFTRLRHEAGHLRVEYGVWLRNKENEFKKKFNHSQNQSDVR